MNWQDTDEGPARDPLDLAAENAARRYLSGEPMAPIDWEALKAKAISELMEYDNTQKPF